MITPEQLNNLKRKAADLNRQREEAFAQLTAIAEKFPDLIQVLVETMADADPMTQSSPDTKERGFVLDQTIAARPKNGREEERGRKLAVIMEVMRQYGRPMSYKMLESATDMTRSALRNVIETLYRHKFTESADPSDNRTSLWAPAPSRAVVDPFSVFDIDTEETSLTEEESSIV